MDNTIVFSNFDFADSTYKSLSLSENYILTIDMHTWQEIPFKLIFENVIYFLFNNGDFPKNLHKVAENSQFFINAVAKQYVEKPPTDHPYKGYELKDISDFAFIEIVAESVLLLRNLG